MEHFNLKKISSDVNLFDKRMRMFYNKSEANYSYIGINYQNQNILSLKFYYVFFDLMQFKNHFPFADLNKNFYDIIEHASDLVYEPKSNGGGLTLTTKFNGLGEKSIGFYLRCNGDNSQFVSNIMNCYPDLSLIKEDFEPGFGSYFMLIDGIITTNNYVYLKPTSKLKELEEKYEIAFSKSQGIEIASANCNFPNKQKFIALGGPELMGKGFLNKIPKNFKEIAEKMNAKFICPAINGGELFNTCYIFRNDTNLVNSFIKLYE